MMLYEELFIDGKALDIKGVEIERTYETPFFSDITKILSDSTKTIKLPKTENNKAVMEYLHSADMNTDFPYTFHYADYYLNGMQLIKNGEVKVIGDFEIHIVYGIDRAKYLPLKEKFLNLSTPRTVSDWISNWDISVIGRVSNRYKYLNYVSGERTSDVITDNAGVVQPPVQPDEPFLSNAKSMTMHPFVAFNDMLDLINEDNFILATESIVSSSNPIQYQISFPTIISNLVKVGDKLMKVNNVDVSDLLIFIELIPNDYTINFTSDVDLYYVAGCTIEIETYKDLIDFTVLKNRLKKKGLILGGENTNDSIDNIISFDGTAKPVKTYNSIDLGTLSKSIKIENGLVKLQQGLKNALVYVILDISVKSDAGSYMRLIERTQYGDETVVFDIFNNGSETVGGQTYYIYKQNFAIDITDNSKTYYVKFINTISTYTVKNGGTITTKTNDLKCIYDINGTGNGRYDIIANLPVLTQTEFIKQLLILTGLYITYDENGSLIFKSLDELKSNYINSNCYDWSGKISNVRNSKYQFNSNAKKNWIKYKNWDDINYIGHDYITVNDETLDAEKDLIECIFSLANEGYNKQSEFILYKQTSTSNGKTGVDLQKTFKNEYQESESVCVYDANGFAINKYILPKDTVGTILLKMSTYRESDYVINISEYFEPDVLIPEIGNKLTKLDGVEQVGVYVVDRNDNLITLNQNIITDTNEHFVEFEDSSFGFITQYYQTYQKLINRPIVKEVDVLLDFYESSQIDFTKPIYIKEWGKYCMLLELNASNKGLSQAKLLLINQTL